MQQLDSSRLVGGPQVWNPYAPKVSAPGPASGSALAYRFNAGEKLCYDVEFAWQVRSGKLTEYLQGTARVSVEAYPTAKGYTLRCSADKVSIERSSPKAPPLSIKTRTDILLAPRGEILALKWTGMVLPFRGPFWLCFPASGVPHDNQWQEEIDLGLPLLEKLRFPLNFALESKPDAVLVKLSHDKADADASVHLAGEVLFSRSKGYATRTALSVMLKGRTEVSASVKATYVDGPAFEEEAFLFTPR